MHFMHTNTRLWRGRFARARVLSEVVPLRDPLAVEQAMKKAARQPPLDPLLSLFSASNAAELLKARAANNNNDDDDDNDVDNNDNNNNNNSINNSNDVKFARSEFDQLALSQV
jgi:hypothetical protein